MALEEAQIELFKTDFDRVRQEIGKVIVGQEAIVDSVLVALFAGGHVLLEGVPGLGKTLLVRTLAQVLQLNFSRVQFTPDLMPADITGTTMIVEDPQSGRRSFEFQPGPVFANIVLADEVNRATPKTQSALLEAGTRSYGCRRSTCSHCAFCRDRDAESDRDGGDLSVARGPTG